MENTPTTLTSLWNTISSVITNLVSLLGDMTEALLGNLLFQIVLGIIFFGMGIGFVFGLVRKVKNHGR